MSNKPANKDTQINIRLSSQVKDLLEASAARLGMNASEYVRFLIIEDARRSLDRATEPPSE